MLERLTIQNFRCLSSVDVPLRPLTVLIGRNDTGKSALLTAIDRLANDRRSFAATDYWRCDSTSALVIGGVVDGVKVAISPVQSGTRVDGDPGLLTRLNPVNQFQLPSGGVAMTCEGYSDGQEGALELGATGHRVPALLDYLLRTDRMRLDRIVAVLRDLVPGFEDVDIATPNPAMRRVDLVIENGLRIQADLASVGLRMLLFFVALAYHPRPPRVILLEEPENGVHPQRLEDIICLLREITEGKHGGNAAQVVLTTHSPYLLDHVDLARDQVLVFQRNDDGSRSAEPADAERLRTFLDEFMLGEVWYNQGEEGLVSRK